MALWQDSEGGFRKAIRRADREYEGFLKDPKTFRGAAGIKVSGVKYVILRKDHFAGVMHELTGRWSSSEVLSRAYTLRV